MSWGKEKVMIVQFLVVIPAICKPQLSELELVDKEYFFEGPTYPTKLTAEDLVSDVQYNLQTLTGIEDRLAKVEDSIIRQGQVI